MKHGRHLGVSLALGALIAAGLLVSPASAATTTGTWTQYPTGATEYQAEVQQPINTANTSNWNSKSKGAIPVMFKLSSRTGPAVFQSKTQDSDATNDYSFVSFAPAPSITFNGISTLKTDYSFLQGNCGGGSLRWSVRVDVGNDGVAANDGSVFIYYGAEPNTTDCTTSDATSGTDSNQSGENMIGKTDLRYDTSQVGGTFYDTYANAQTLVGNLTVIRASLVIDSGWFAGDQVLNISNTYVNDNVYQFVSSAGGSFTGTCDLPTATIEVSKNDPVVSGDINEAAVQASLADDGNAFRIVDCKYQYILSIPSLDGKGTYEVQIWINGTRVPTSPNAKVMFDIK
jgi:hypothetical protein